MRCVPQLLRFPVLLILLVPALNAAAQARSAAEQPIHLQVFAMPSLVTPDFAHSGSNVGFTGGGDADFITRWDPIQISAEFRAQTSPGDLVTENLISGGPRIVADVRRVQPYAFFLFGYGTIHFNKATNSYKQDNSAVYSYGGGVDVAIAGSWGLRADVQRQHWQISYNQPAFFPTQASIGLRYQFHFRNR